MIAIDRAELEKAIAYYCGGHAELDQHLWVKEFVAVFAAAQAHLATLPKTKMVERWKIAHTYKGVPGAWQFHDTLPDAVAALASLAACPRTFSDLTLTGPHQHEVPA